MEKLLPDFLIKPGQLLEDPDIQSLDGDVYGIVYWCNKMRLKRCFLKDKQIAEILHKNVGSVKNAISRLKKKGYIESVYDRNDHQRELIPLLTFGKKSKSSGDDVPEEPNEPGHQKMTGRSSTDDLAGHPQMTPDSQDLGTPNNIINENINNTVNVNGNESILKKLPTLSLSKQEKEFIKQVILDQLQDKHSECFYRLVASRVPEGVIREKLSEVKNDGADNPPACFTTKIMNYAFNQQKSNMMQSIGGML